MAKTPEDKHAETLAKVREAATLHTKGMTYEAIANRLNVKTQTLVNWRLRYAVVWGQASLAVPQSERKRGAREIKDVSHQVRQAAELAAMGRTDSAIAKHLRVDEQTVANWRNIYGEIWQSIFEYEVKRIADQAKHDMETMKGGNRPLWSFCEFMFLRKTKIRSVKTRLHYRYSVNSFAKFLGREPVKSDLKNETISLWLTDMVQRFESLDDPKSVNTAISYVTRMTTLWRFLNDIGEMPTRPIVEMPSAPDPCPISLNEAELRRLFEAAECQPGFIFGIPARYWWPAIFAFAFSTSERKGAILALRWEWVDLEQGIASIPAAFRKGKKKSATYKLWPEVVELLKRIREPKRDMVFAWELSEGSFYKHFGRILAYANLPCDRKHKMHSLRVSHNTLHKMLTGQHSPALQHSSSRTSEKHYEDRRYTTREPVKPFVPWKAPAGVAATPVNGKPKKLPRAKLLAERTVAQ